MRFRGAPVSLLPFNAQIYLQCEAVPPFLVFLAPSSSLSLVPSERLVSVKLEYIALRVSEKDSFTTSTVIVGLAQHEFCHITCSRTAAEHRSSHGKPTTCSPIQSRLCVDTGGTYLEKKLDNRLPVLQTSQTFRKICFFPHVQ